MARTLAPTRTTRQTPVTASSVPRTALSPRPGMATPGSLSGPYTALLGTVTAGGPVVDSAKIDSRGVTTLPAQSHEPRTGTLEAVATPSSRVVTPCPRPDQTAQIISNRTSHPTSGGMTRMATKTPYQLNRELLAQTGASHLIRIKPGDEVKAVVADQVVILTYKTRISSNGTETRTHEGMRLVRIRDGRVMSDQTTWAELERPVTVLAHRDERNTPSEWRARALYEQDCYRPGMDSRLGQRDSFARECQGYWNGGK